MGNKDKVEIQRESKSVNIRLKDELSKGHKNLRDWIYIKYFVLKCRGKR